jgi:subtilisin family serine protease
VQRRTGLAAERLEDRRLLTASSGDEVGQSYSDVMPIWFASLADVSASVRSANGLGPSLAAVSVGPAAAVLRNRGTVARQNPGGGTAGIAAGTDGSGVHEWIVRLSSRALETVHTVADAAAYLGAQPLGLEVVEGLGLPGQVLVRATAALGAVEQYFTTDVGIASFSQNGRTQLSATPNDPSYSQLYALNNVGQGGGTPDADIDAPEAWNVTKGSSSIVVGVIDTGIDYTHPDLAANVWTNPGEIPGNGLDDDRNGFVDDVHGYDFVSDDGDPMDDHGHGTHVSGTIGAVGNNGTGVVGVNWNVSLMALKFLDASGAGYTSDAIRAVNYATMMRTTYNVNVRVTSNSWSGGDYDAGLLESINAGGAAGIMFVAAAGNNGVNADVSPSYPAAYDSAAIVSVAATGNNDSLASFSNYGMTTVDLAAPGVNIYSTLPGNGYGFMSGTSMATPHVAGAAALALAVDPSLSVAQLKRRLLDTVDPIASLAGKVASGGRLNAFNVVSFVAGGPTLAIASSTSLLRRGEVATITFTLSGPSTDFTAADVTVTGGVLSDFAGSGTDYTATFTPASGFAGLGTVTVAAGVFTDSSGKPNARVALAPGLVVDTAALEVFGTTLSLGFAADGSFVGPSVGARWNGIEFLRYGTFLANWTIAIDGRNYNNAAAAGQTSFPVTMVDASAGGSHEVRITGSPRAGVSVVRTVRWLDGDNHAFVTTTITNNTSAALSRVALLENDDPDPDGVFDTSNDVLRGGRLVVGSAAGGAMALGSADPRAVASAEGFFVGNPSDVLLSPVDPDGYAHDYTINLAFNIGMLAAGASDTSSFAMIFGADQQAVASQFDVIAAGWPPIVTIGTNKASVRADETATLTFTLTKPSTTFTASAVTVTGGTLSNVAGSGTNYTATFTPTAGYAGPATVVVAAGSFTDANDVANLGATLAAPINVDAILPAITITANKGIVKAGATAVITFRLSEVSRDFTASDVAVTGGTLTNFTGTGATYTATFTPSPGFDGSGTFAVAARSFTDAFGNPNTAGVLDPAIRVDTIAPTITIAADKTALKAGEKSVLTFTLSEAPMSFTQGMVAVTGGVLSNFTGSGTSYTATFTPSAGFTGSGTVSVAAGRFADAAGNANLAGALSPAFVIDTKLPTVAIATSQGRLKAGDTAVLAFTLSESASDFTVDDVAVAGGVLSSFAGSGTSYTATFTPTAGFTGSGTVSVAAGKFTDAVGNTSLAGVLSPALVIDTKPPTVAVTSSLQTLKAGTTAVLTFRLSEVSKDFTASDVAVTGGTLTNFAGSGATYTATFTPTAGLVGTGTVAIDAGAFTDAAGNASVAGALVTPLRIDMVVPTITIAADKTALKAGEKSVLTFTLSEAPVSFTQGMVAVTGGVLSNFTGSGTSYTATFTPSAGFTGSGTVSVAAGRFADAAGNANLAGALSPAFVIDTKLPTVAIATSQGRLKAGDTAVLAFTLSESASDFTVDDVAVAGGVLSSFAGSGTSYTATFTPTAGFTGSGTVSVAAGKFTDAVGNTSLAGVLSPALVIDTKPPTVAVTSSLQTLKAGTTAVLTFRLSEVSKDFTASDVAVTGGTLTNFTGSGATYTATFTPTAGLVGSGTVAIDVGAFTDAAGNANVAATLPSGLTLIA